MPFSTKEAKAKYMSEWKKRRAQTSEVYRCKRCGYVKKHYAWKKICIIFREIDPSVFC